MVINPLRQTAALPHASAPLPRPPAFALVMNVAVGSPAHVGGLHIGDRIISLFGARSFEDVAAAIAKAESTEKPQPVSVLRMGEPETLLIAPRLAPEGANPTWAGNFGAGLEEIAEADAEEPMPKAAHVGLKLRAPVVAPLSPPPPPPPPTARTPAPPSSPPPSSPQPSLPAPALPAPLSHSVPKAAFPPTSAKSVRGMAPPPPPPPPMSAAAARSKTEAETAAGAHAATETATTVVEEATAVAPSKEEATAAASGMVATTPPAAKTEKKKLKELRAQGVLDDEEFEAQIARLVARTIPDDSLF